MQNTSLKKPILVTGGMGYIGSHTVLELSQARRDVVILDNLSNSSPQVLERVNKLSGHKAVFEQGDVRDAATLHKLFAKYEFDSVIHFAGLKAVGESVEKPILYYQNNVVGSLALFRAMAEAGCKKLVFSSSATVYGDPDKVPISEGATLTATNPYGQSKLMVEEILRDLFVADLEWRISILRYFNPVAAHPSGLIGEDPSGIPNNLVPYIAQVAVGRREALTVHGDDYETVDGTGVRDYVHVVDLAQAHLAALTKLDSGNGCTAYNIGTGEGYSVLDVVRAFESACGQKVAYEVGPRRAGDIATCYADPALANTELGWHAESGLQKMMDDHWRWQSNNPNGYSED